MHPFAPYRLRWVLTIVAAQAMLWLALALAFSALLVLAGGFPWLEALTSSAFNWLPWALLAPLVFWLSARYPLLRGHLLRRGIFQMMGAVVCVVLSMEVARQAPTNNRGLINLEGPGFVRPAPPDQPPREIQEARRGAANGRLGKTPTTSSPEASFPAGLTGGGLPESTPARFGPSLVRVNFSLAIYFFVATAAHAFVFYRRSQERSRQALELATGLNAAKLDVLRLQLQPHFLFNTLSAIATLVHRDARAADKLIGHLSDLLRHSLRTSANAVPLQRELELLDGYLAIEQARLGERLLLIRTIDPAATGAFVPTFFLQPLVENAVRHGVEPRCTPGTISFSAERAGDSLRIVVADDGVGLAADKPEQRRGIGLTNTESRLAALYGAAAELEILSPPSGGVRVVVTLPFQLTPPTATA